MPVGAPARLLKAAHEALAQGDYPAAEASCTEALKVTPNSDASSRATAFSDRAAAKLKLRCWQAALDDAKAAVGLVPMLPYCPRSWEKIRLKALYRSALAHEGLSQLHEAYKQLETAFALADEGERAIIAGAAKRVMSAMSQDDLDKAVDPATQRFQRGLLQVEEVVQSDCADSIAELNDAHDGSPPGVEAGFMVKGRVKEELLKLIQANPDDYLRAFFQQQGDDATSTTTLSSTPMGSVESRAHLNSVAMTFIQNLMQSGITSEQIKHPHQKRAFERQQMWAQDEESIPRRKNTDVAQLIKENPDAAGSIKLVSRTGAKLKEVFQGDQDVLNLLFA